MKFLLGILVRDYDDILYETYKHAVDILEALVFILKDVGVVTYADYMTLLGCLPSEKMSRMGWTDLSEAHVKQDEKEKAFRLILPKMKKVNGGK